MTDDTNITNPAPEDETLSEEPGVEPDAEPQVSVTPAAPVTPSLDSVAPSVVPPVDSVIPAPAPNPAIWEDIAPKPKPKETPSLVKAAAALVIVHGVALSLNAILMAKETNDWSEAPKALIWLGCTIVLAGALFDRQVLAWWFVTLFGGIVGVINTLAVFGFFLGRSMGTVADVYFKPMPIAMGAAAMLLGVVLLLLPDAKAAFGITKENPTGLL
jgi:hypothetical protein